MLYLLALVAQFAAIWASSCNPLSTSCSPDPALGTSLVENFNEESDRFSVVATPSGVAYTENGLELTLKKQGDNPGIQSDFYIMFGRVEVLLKAAPGQGIVSSFFLMSDDLDEVDIELLGGDTTQFQSNFFSKGYTGKYDRGEYHSTPGSPQENFLNYTVTWTSTEIVWYLEGVAMRTLSSNNPQGFPQSPMYIKAGIWAGGDPDNQPGTIEWAGGLTDYSKAPFTMGIKKLVVDDYSTGDKYEYSNTSGSWQSIKAVNGKINGRLGSQAESDSELVSSSSSSSSSSPSSSSSSSTSLSSSSSSSTSSSSSSSTTSSSSTSSSSSSSSTTSGSSTSTSTASKSTLSTELSSSAASTSSSSRVSSTSAVSTTLAAISRPAGSASTSIPTSLIVDTTLTSQTSASSTSASATPSVSSITDNMGISTGLSGFLVFAAIALHF